MEQTEVLPQAMKCWQPLKDVRGKKIFSLHATRRYVVPSILLFKNPGLRTVKRIYFFCFKALLCGNLLHQSQKTNIVSNIAILSGPHFSQLLMQLSTFLFHNLNILPPFKHSGNMLAQAYRLCCLLMTCQTTKILTPTLQLLNYLLSRLKLLPALGLPCLNNLN